MTFEMTFQSKIGCIPLLLFFLIHASLLQLSREGAACEQGRMSISKRPHVFCGKGAKWEIEYYVIE